jgi:hypothetical protein
VHTNKDPGHAWLWEVRPCQYSSSPDCVHVNGTPRPNGVDSTTRAAEVHRAAPSHTPSRWCVTKARRTPPRV